MRKSLLALAGAAAVTAAAPSAAQLADQSGTLTFRLQVAKHVEVVSHEPSSHDLTDVWGPDGMPPGYGAIGTDNLFETSPTIREVRANTPFRVTVLGLTADGKLVFRNARGAELTLATACDMLTSTNPDDRDLLTIFDCVDSPVFLVEQPMSSRWVLFHAYTPLRTDTENAAAGVYTATVYIQIDAI
jgi:hypothetical protein